MAALVIHADHARRGICRRLPELLGLICTGMAAKTTGNHILALVAGMGTFWLINNNLTDPA